MSKIWILWHQYGDKSGAHVERAYQTETRAKEDLALLTEGESKYGAHEWFIAEAELFE